MSVFEMQSSIQSFDSVDTGYAPSSSSSKEGKRPFYQPNYCSQDAMSASSNVSFDMCDLNKQENHSESIPPRFSDLFLPPFLGPKFSTASSSDSLYERALKYRSECGGEDSGFVSNRGSGDMRDLTLAMSSDLSQFVDGETTDPETDSDSEHEAESDERPPSPLTGIGRSRRSSSSADGPAFFDLKAPLPSSPPPSNIEHLADRLFSLDHLKVIVCDSTASSRLHAFLKKYRPEAVGSLNRFLETQKALGALEYANSIAGSLSPGSPAATIDDEFIQGAREAINEVVNDILPAYITHRLVLIVTEALVKEITGENTPVMRDLVGGLAEVYCMTDPNLPDNPIVYASDEFYRYTQYGRNHVIGRNCRFLQGPKTSGSTIQRLMEALTDGTEICETILNYRRDGTPFLNLLMIAPLHDNTGAIRYFIGAQIDVTKLVERGRGLDSFEKLLANDRAKAHRIQNSKLSPDPQKALEQLGELFDEVDLQFVGKGAGKRKEYESRSPPLEQRSSTPVPRKYVGMEDAMDQELWPSLSLGPSGRLPGAFQSYMLVRPHPSLRVTFTSPTLRIPGLLQSKFMEHIGGPSNTRQELITAFAAGTRLTARIEWLPHGINGELQEKSSSSHRPTTHSSNSGDEQKQKSKNNRKAGKSRWIHCTPLVGSDNKIGVWMVVMVESEFVTGNLNVSDRAAREAPALPIPSKGPRGFEDISNNCTPTSQPSGEATSKHYINAMPPSRSVSFPQSPISPPMSPEPKPKQTVLQSDKLYRDYLRREGRPDSLLNAEI